jgi:hypothetical protein
MSLFELIHVDKPTLCAGCVMTDGWEITLPNGRTESISVCGSSLCPNILDAYGFNPHDPRNPEFAPGCSNFIDVTPGIKRQLLNNFNNCKFGLRRIAT